MVSHLPCFVFMVETGRIPPDEEEEEDIPPREVDWFLEFCPWVVAGGAQPAVIVWLIEARITSRNRR